MKKQILIGMSLLGMVTLAGCNNQSTSETTTTSIPTTPAEASTSESSVPTSTTEQTSTPTSTTTSAGTRTKVTADATLWIVGDSTVDEFLNADGSVKDSTYFYERCGWGGHIKDYTTDKLTVVNYGASGRSSKDFLTYSKTKPYYDNIQDNIKAGDFLMIGFGHNDEKSEDPTRFTDASKPTTDSTSFKYSLYENYIKMAEEKGATAILCTPIARYDSTDQYEKDKIHNYEDKNIGDYRKAIVELGEEKNVKVIDLTTYTKNVFQEAGYEEAVYFFSMASGLSENEPNVASIDGTHINNYGAKIIDYYIADELYKDNNCSLGGYIIDERTKPTKENDLKKNSSFKYMEYSAPNLASYNPASQFTTLSNGWYGTAFGDCGGDPASSSNVNGYYATETSSGVFKVGQYLSSGSKGKIASNKEGFAFAFMQVSKNDNFELTATAKVLQTAQTEQSGFGLTMRDACWTPNKLATCISNHLSAALLQNKNDMTANFWRSDLTQLSKSSNTITGKYSVDDVVTFKVTRTGQQFSLKTIYNGVEYVNNEFTDFDLLSIDTDYFYIGMFATRGTLVEFTNVTYTKTGESQGA